MLRSQRSRTAITPSGALDTVRKHVDHGSIRSSNEGKGALKYLPLHWPRLKCQRGTMPFQLIWPQDIETLGLPILPLRKQDAFA
jgi:hypothetical protein